MTRNISDTPIGVLDEGDHVLVSRSGDGRVERVPGSVFVAGPVLELAAIEATVASHTTSIAANTSGVAVNTAAIAAHTTDITGLETDVATNAAAIAAVAVTAAVKVHTVEWFVLGIAGVTTDVNARRMRADSAVQSVRMFHPVTSPLAGEVQVSAGSATIDIVVNGSTAQTIIWDFALDGPLKKVAPSPTVATLGADDEVYVRVVSVTVTAGSWVSPVFAIDFIETT